MLSNLLHRLGGAWRVPLPCPARPLAVIGDVHGSLGLLQDMLAKLPADAEVILVGDYIDRGEDSAGVLRFLADRPDLICLRGNHEDMLLRFLADPSRHGPRWLQHGGVQTLASFGIVSGPPSVAANVAREALTDCRDALLAALGAELLDFVTQLLPSYLSGNVLVSHAGANPAVAPDDQDPAVLAWGHPDFDRIPRRDGIWVAYGHVIQDRAKVLQRRIAIDTGAYATGRLSAVYLAPEAEPAFISVLR